MTSGAAAGAGVGAPRIAAMGYIAAHRRDLESAAGAPLWAFCVAVLARSGTHRPPTSGAALCLVAAAFLAVWLVSCIRRWYRRNYGYVEPPPLPGVPSALIALNLAGKSAAIGAGRERTASHSSSADNPFAVVLYFALFALDLVLGTAIPKQIGSFAPLLLPVSMLLLPRCRYRTPAVAPLRARLWLARGLLVLLPALMAATDFHWVSLITPYVVLLCGWAVLMAYDHWLLMHYLGGTASLPSEAIDG